MKTFQFDFIYTAIFATLDYIATILAVLIFNFSWDLELNPIIRNLGAILGSIGVILWLPIIIGLEYSLFYLLEKVNSKTTSFLVATVLSTGHILALIFWCSASIPILQNFTYFLRQGNNLFYIIFLLGGCSIPILIFHEYKLKNK